MAVLDRLLARWGYSKAERRRPEWQRAEAEARRFDIPSGELYAHQAELYQRLSWVLIGVQQVAMVAATSRLKVMELQGEKRNEIINHSFEELLERPNPDESRYELIYKTMAYWALTGNTFWDLNRGSQSQPPQELYCIPTPNIQPIPSGTLVVSGYKYDPGGGLATKDLDAWRVMHVKRFNPSNPWMGLSPIEALATVAVSDLKMQEWQANFFGRDNAKPSGILGFKDEYSHDDWEAMKDQVKEQYGGTRRALMMLNGITEGGIQWIETAIAQKDMEFLGSRKFTKEEILGVYAPGLASMLDVNSTEANAKAGKTLFMDFCASQMDALAQSITSKILPSYGPHLIAEFDNVRITDRQLELAEIEAYSRTHTINEVRERYYEDKPIEGERGELYPAEVGPQSIALLVPPEPVPAALQQQAATETVAEEPGQSEDEAQQTEAIRAAEIGKWRRYAAKRTGEKAAEFVPEHLPGDVASIIRQRLVLAQSPEEVKAAFSGPFLIKAERRDKDGNRDPNARAKDEAETELQRLIESRLNGQLREVRRLLGDPPDLGNLPMGFWDTQAGLMLSAVRVQLEKLAYEAGLRMLLEQGVGLAWDVVATQAAEWARNYVGQLIRGITETTRAAVGRAVARYIEEKGRTIGDLYATLEPWFGPVRAEMISVTEITRAYAMGELETVRAAQAIGLNMRRIWHSNRDELVCSLCGPLDNQETTETPPLHPRCRCWISHEWVQPT